MQIKELQVTDDTTYKLSMSCNAMIAVEEKVGVGFPKILLDLAEPDNIKIAMVRALFWGCFRDNHPEVTIEQAGDLMMAHGGLGPTIETITGLIGDSETA